MTTRAPWRVAPVLVLALAGAARAQVKDAAELLPAETLACVEVRHPEGLAREVATRFKGSALDDMPATLAQRRARMGANDSFWILCELGALALFLSRAAVGEAGRLPG